MNLRTRRAAPAAAMLLATSLLGLPSQAAAQVAAPDRIFHGGSIITADAEGHVAEAIAIRDGKILQVGKASDILALADTETVVTDLKGRSVIPGFVDAHSHFLGVGTTALYRVDLNSPPIGEIRSIDDIVRVLAEKAKTVPEGGTIQGRGYDDTLLAEKRHPTRHDLDRVSTRHRVIIRHISGHFLAANSYALEQSQVDSLTRVPAGGVMRRDENGAPNGVMEESAMGLVKAGPGTSLDRAARLRTVKYAAELYASKGFTLAQNGSTGGSTYRLFLDAKRQGLVPIRLLVLPNRGLATSLGDYRELKNDVDSPVILGPVKHFSDGSIQGYTGHLSEPYHSMPPGKTDYKGYPRQPCERLETRVGALAALGWRAAIHANGDAAIECTLRVFGKARSAYPLKDYRPIIIHAQMAREDQLERMRGMDAIPSFFSLHTYYWGDRHRDQFIGPDRAAGISPAATAQKLGLHYTVHTDSPVVPLEPMRLLWATVNRKTTSGAVLGADERASVQDALRAMTYNAAYQYGLEDEIGSLEKGKEADIVVLDRDLLAIDPDDIKSVSVAETIVGGKTVFKQAAR